MSEWNGSLKIFISSGKNLAIGDIVSSDPYCLVTVSNSENQLLVSHKTKVIDTSLNPDWKEHFYLSLLPSNKKQDLTISFAVWDKDNCSPDDFLGQTYVTFTPGSALLNKLQSADLQPRQNKKDRIKVQGSVEFQVDYYPNKFISSNAFKYHNHKFTGLARSVTAGESARIYGTYQIELFHIEEIFGDNYQHWNEKYEAARKIFGSPLIMRTITTQHQHLYSDISITKKGKIECGDELLKLLKNGFKGGKPRFFTYVITDNVWSFSETGASFFADFTSKHAMHACVSQTVRYAGEFHFRQFINSSGNPSYKLVIDNNSGTYSPTKNLLPQLEKLMRLNFDGLEVEVLDFREERLKMYKEDLERIGASDELRKSLRVSKK